MAGALYGSEEEKLKTRKMCYCCSSHTVGMLVTRALLDRASTSVFILKGQTQAPIFVVRLKYHFGTASSKEFHEEMPRRLMWNRNLKLRLLIVAWRLPLSQPTPRICSQYRCCVELWLLS